MKKMKKNGIIILLITNMSEQVCYMMMFNYFDTHYSMIKRINTLEDAYNYICSLEKIQEGLDDDEISFKLIHGPPPKRQIRNTKLVCCLPFDSYNEHSVCDYVAVSQYVIVPI